MVPAGTFFSIRSAERLLPELTRLLDYIRSEVTLYQRWGKARHFTDNDVREVIEEIESHGCILRDPRIGIVDFPAIRLGEPVYLCWRFGEKRIRYWHRIGEACTKRRPIKREEFYGDEEIRSYTVKKREILHDEEEYEDKIIITIDMRGVDQGDIMVEPGEDRVKVLWRDGRHVKAKAIALHKRIEPSTLATEYRNGVLIITAKKKR